MADRLLATQPTPKRATVAECLHQTATTLEGENGANLVGRTPHDAEVLKVAILYLRTLAEDQ